MKNRKRSFKPVPLLTGKYGVLLLTVLNVCLVCAVITLSGYWYTLDIGNTVKNSDYMTYYLADYRIGFVPRAFIGSVLALFTDHPTLRMVKTVLYITVLCTTLLFCLFQAILAKKALLVRDYGTLLLSYLFFLNKAFWENAFREFGLLDIFMILLLQLYLLCAERKHTLGFRLAPVVCFIGLCIHNAFFLSCFPVVAAILWYEMLHHGKPDRVCLSMFVVSCILSAALFLFFVFFPQTVVRVGPDELIELLRQKYDGQISADYYIYYLYRSDAAKSPETISALDYLDLASDSIGFFSPKVFRQFLNILPLTVPYIYGCVYHARKSGGRLIAYLGFLAPLVMLFPATFFSTDKERFFSLFILAQYMLLHYIVTQSDVRFLPGIDDPPQKKLSAYAAEQRRKKAVRVLIACAVAGAVYTIAATQFV